MCDPRLPRARWRGRRTGARARGAALARGGTGSGARRMPNDRRRPGRDGRGGRTCQDRCRRRATLRDRWRLSRGDGAGDAAATSPHAPAAARGAPASWADGWCGMWCPRCIGATCVGGDGARERGDAAIAMRATPGRPGNSLGMPPARRMPRAVYCARCGAFIYSPPAPIACARGYGVASSRKEFLHIATLVDIGRRDVSLHPTLRPSARRRPHRSSRFFNTTCSVPARAATVVSFDPLQPVVAGDPPRDAPVGGLFGICNATDAPCAHVG